MKEKKLFLLTCIAMIGILINLNIPSKVKAQNMGSFLNINNNPKMTIYPKQMRGTWYSYTKYNGIMTIKIFKKKEISSFYEKKGGKLETSISTLHKFKPYNGMSLNESQSNKISKFVYVKFTFDTKLNNVKRHWINLYGMLQSAGDGSFYNVSTLYGRHVLSIGAGAGNSLGWTGSQYYRNKKIAKKLYHKHYQGFLYQSFTGFAYGASKKIHKA